MDSGPLEPIREHNDQSYAVTTHHAHALQQSAKEVISELTQSPEADFEWSFPAQTFPEAVIIMASCLVAGSHESIGAIHLQVFAPGSTETISSYTALPALLAECSDLGRAAFTGAEIEMREIRSLTSFMVSRGGTIPRIIELLNNPEEAKDALEAELKVLEDYSKQCVKCVESIRKLFSTWLEFISSLDKSLINSKCNGFQASAVRLEGSVDAAQQEWEQTKVDLEKALKAEDEADKALAEAISLDLPGPLSEEGIMTHLSEMFAKDDRTWPGTKECFNFIWHGQRTSQREKREREKILAERMNGIRMLMKESVTKSEEERKSLALKIENLRQSSEGKAKKATAAKKAHLESTKRLSGAQGRMEQVKQNLERLGREIRIGDVHKILGQSISELKKMKNHVDHLGAHFDRISRKVEDTARLQLWQFQRRMNSGTQASPSATRYDKMAFSKTSRMAMLKNLYRIQGGYSTIKDISQTYDLISERYIRPGIRKMDTLTLYDMSTYEANRQDLDEWCETLLRKSKPLLEAIIRGVEDNIQTLVDTATAEDGFFVE